LLLDVLFDWLDELLELWLELELDVLWLLDELLELNELLDELLEGELWLLLELLELLDELELLELLELLSSASWRPKSQIENVTPAPLAVTRMLKLPPEIAKPASAGWALNNTPWPRRAPPVATVWVPIGVQPFELWGSISRAPAAPIALWFWTQTATISSSVRVWPTASAPEPPPTSREEKSARSTTRLSPAARYWFLYCQARLASLALTPLVSVLVMLALIGAVATVLSIRLF